MYRITAKMIKRAGACVDGMAAFERAFPKGVKVDLSSLEENHVDWTYLNIYWLAKKLLPHSYVLKFNKEYNKELAKLTKILGNNSYIKINKLRAKHFIVQYLAYKNDKKVKKGE